MQQWFTFHHQVTLRRLGLQGLAAERNPQNRLEPARIVASPVP
jgi:hypothetical protein